jgi:succinoglycan biosynthesis protein ExoM
VDHVTVIVCTYRRPLGLSRLLESLEQLEAVQLPMRCVVVDNNAESEQVLLERNYSFPLDVVREPRKGIPWARNAGLEKALASEGCRFVAFVDDDEEVPPPWLYKLFEVQRETRAPVVTGPVDPRFTVQPPSWVLTEKLFDRERYPTGTELNVAYTHNVLIEASILRQTGLRFNPAFVRGEDSHFFRCLVRDGHRIVWADEAGVYEWNTDDRLRIRWVLGREFVQGYLRAHIELHFNPGLVTRLKLLVSAFTRFIRGGTLLLASPFIPYAIQVRGLCRVCAGAGRLLATLGIPYSPDYNLGNLSSKS